MLKNKAARESVKAALQPLIDNNIVKDVYTAKPSGLSPEELPVISVYFDDGDIVERGISATETGALLTVEVLTKEITNVDDELDAIAQQALDVLNASLPAGFSLFNHVSFSYLRDPESALAALLNNFNCKF